MFREKVQGKEVENSDEEGGREEERKMGKREVMEGGRGGEGEISSLFERRTLRRERGEMREKRK